ncbi:hypothetical protein [Nocardia cyriacigeorgica]|uniref:hypothetical protein n=1 Tax=Nocardia cyriacigeorgica TaxID=135487 RepID=UPI001893ABAC|nr:hypothetical protein [Nocardia cyriacigeorgica]MBF6162999.1 hypothetical protein [Nocardia cyriacigeorgica]MBF6201978.1 hypothetical protein [Nocardia cyriacigeorgica]
MARIRERVVSVWVIPTPESSGGSIIGVPAVMAGIVGGVLALAVAAAIALAGAYPGTEYTNVPSTRQLGPCEPFCSMRTTNPAPVGGGQR